MIGVNCALHLDWIVNIIILEIIYNKSKHNMTSNGFETLGIFINYYRSLAKDDSNL